MTLGVSLVIVFSDPMVGIFDALGTRTGIPAFYIAFILAPLASNLSELIAAYNYATKKTKHHMTIALQTLEGAACMNNTFCLSIFLILIYFKKLIWKFSAETITILFAEIVVGCIAMRRSMNVLVGSVVVFLVYPASIALVWTLTKICKMD